MKIQMILKQGLKATMVFAVAGLLMGNQSCEKKPAPEARTLKKIVEIGQIASRPIQLPDGNVFDFQFVVNQQIYNVLYESKAFAFRYNAPVEGLGVFSDGTVLARLNLGKESSEFIEKTMGQNANEMLIPSKEAWCLLNKPQARINGAVTSFELVGGGGLSLGFTPAGDHNITGIGASFKMQKYELEVILNALAPIKKTLLASVSQRNTKTDSEIGFQIQFGSFAVGPSYFSQTPMAKVTRKNLEGAVNSLKEELKKEEWFTRVLDFNEGDNNLVAIIGGSDTGVRKGDQLAIYTETTFWKGEPCNSELAFEGGISGSPVAIIEIEDVSAEVSSGHVTQLFQDFNPKNIVGAKVKVHKLKEDTPAPAAKTKSKALAKK